MRILVAAYDFRPRLGGVATCGFELSRALASLPGVQVQVLAPRPPLAAEPADEHGSFTTVRRWIPGPAMAAVLPLAYHASRQIVSWRPDAVIDMLWQPEGVASLLSLPVRAITRTPYFVVAHGVEVMESRGTWRKRLRSSLSFVKRRVFRGARAVLPVSRFTRDLVTRECGVPTDRMCVIFNGVDTEAFMPGPPPLDLVRRHGLEGRRAFLTVTRLDDYKGVDRALGALRYVVGKHPEVVYVICGDGVDRPRIERLIAHFGLREHVVMAGIVTPDRLADYYNLSECFVLLSREDAVTPNFEGFGIVLLEAAACGKPSIAGRSGGISDAVADGETGWLVDPCDEYAISRAMLQVLDDATLAAARGRAARERVVGGLTWKHMARRVMDEVSRHVRD